MSPALRLATGPGGSPRIAILAAGSRGDAQPVVALALRLQSVGCTAKLFVSRPHDELARSFSIDAFGFDLPAVCLFIPSVQNDAIGAIYPAVRSFGPDLILYKADTMMAEAWALEHGLGIPSVEYNFQGSGSNDALPFAESKLAWLREKLPYGGAEVPQSLDREEVLDRAGRGRPLLLAMSEEFLPRPSPFPLSATTGCHVTGPWVIGENEEEENMGRPDAELVAFLDGRPPPVYMGWGSMPAGLVNTTHLCRVAVGALQSSSRRGVILGGEARLSPQLLEGASAELQAFAAEHVLWLKYAPHEWLLPRCSVVVHHGGIGTTTAALRAGRPSVITPVGFDQPGIADLMVEKGVAVALSHPNDLNVPALVAAMSDCEDECRVASAAAMGERLRAEDGTGRAVDILIEYMSAKGIVA